MNKSVCLVEFDCVEWVLLSLMTRFSFDELTKWPEQMKAMAVDLIWHFLEFPIIQYYSVPGEKGKETRGRSNRKQQLISSVLNLFIGASVWYQIQTFLNASLNWKYHVFDIAVVSKCRNAICYGSRPIFEKVISQTASFSTSTVLNIKILLHDHQ